jgi:hypothetical protein
MALPLGDPASLLNRSASTGYPTLWPSTLPASSSTAWTSSAGTLTTFLGVVQAGGFDLTKNVLASPDTSSSARLIKFLSSAGTSKLSEVLLKNGSGAYESIVDTFITGAAPKGQAVTSYTFTTSSTLNVAAIVTSLTSVTSGYLLSSAELYEPTQFGDGVTSPVTGSESLVYLYGLQNNNNITPTQTTRIQTLEAKNLRFFGAFLCEYYFYKTRYYLLLAKFFEIYATPAASFTKPDTSTFIGSLFTGAGTDLTQYTLDVSSKITQEDCLKIIGYHLACLNTRMKDMQRILTAVNTYYYGMFDATVLGSNTRITQTITALQASANDSTGYLAQTDFQKAAMEYNSEKNRYANILLSLYAFLNIAALATVFQLARTS